MQVNMFSLGQNLIVIFMCLQGVKMGSMRFRFDGQPINESDTPAQVGAVSARCSVCILLGRLV